MTPHKCPACDGHKTVSRPPWIAGDQCTWSDTSTAPYPCQTCEGTGVVWESVNQECVAADPMKGYTTLTAVGTDECQVWFSKPTPK